jgi:death-on-curing protein
VNEPIWITDLEAVALNHRLTSLFGGLGSGARDENLLRAAPARPINKWHYDDPRPDLYELAAAYASAIARGHVFLDGNKPTAHAVAAVFLLNNGIEHAAAEEEVVAAMVGVAEGSLSKAEIAAWLRNLGREGAPEPRPLARIPSPRSGPERAAIAPARATGYSSSSSLIRVAASPSACSGGASPR